MSRLSETLYEECYESIKFECETRMIFVGHKNVKERVNFNNFERKLESVYFDGSCQNRAFRYFKILSMLY